MSESTSAAPAAQAGASAAAPAAAAAPATAAAAPGGVAPGGAAPAASAAGTPPVAPAATLLSPVDPKPAATDPKPVDGAKPAETAKPADPVAYEAFTLPDGISKDSPLLSTFAEEAGKLGIPQDKAQALVSAVGAKIAADAKAAAEAQMQTWVSTNEAWQAEIKADPNIGGAKFEAMKTSVAKLFDDYVGAVNSPERKALNEALLHTGAGNNPAIVRAFAKVAAAHTEGGFVSGQPARGPVDKAALMYPTMAAGGVRPQG